METMEISSSPVKNRKKGGLRTMPFVIANEAFEKVASVGLQANMILYLKNEYNLDNTRGASIMFLWGAVSNFMPTLGAFLSDSYLGRFRVIASGTLLSLTGISLLWLTTLLPSARPPSCDVDKEICPKPNASQLALLFSAFAVMSMGSGGIRPCSLAFGADQFDNPDNPKNERVLQSFFNWYYASVGISVMISVTVIVYIQTEAGWIVGFGIPVGLMLLSALLFLVGSSLYVKVEPNMSLLTGFARVVVVAFKNKHIAFPPKNGDGWYLHDNSSSRLVLPTDKLRFLNKACIIRNPEKDLNPDGSASQPWNLCTIQQVEEFKSLIKVLPIWSTGIMAAVTVSQHSFQVFQAATMDRHFFSTSLEIPPGSFGIFGILTLTIWIALYDQIIDPFISKFKKDRRGLSLKQRMGIGLFLSCLAMSVSALVERTRRARAINEGLTEEGDAVVKMSAMWLVPQHCLTGLAEAFNIIGQIEFYYSQFPKSMASIGVALFSLGMGVGNLVGSLILGVVDGFSKKGGNVSWVSTNLNKGHYDYYYWVLTILSVANFFYFILCSWAYGCEKQKIWDDGEGLKEEDIIAKENESPTAMRDINAISKGSPVIYTL